MVAWQFLRSSATGPEDLIFNASAVSPLFVSPVYSKPFGIVTTTRYACGLSPIVMSVLTSVTRAAPAFKRPFSCVEIKTELKGCKDRWVHLETDRCDDLHQRIAMLATEGLKDCGSLLLGGLFINDRLQLAIAFVHCAWPTNGSGAIADARSDRIPLSPSKSHPMRVPSAIVA